MTTTVDRALPPSGVATTECRDGTVCENASPCVPHPLKEGSSMCDCAAAGGSSSDDGAVLYAGVYCEHAATSYCQRDGELSGHAFCTNGGECIRRVGRNDVHAGCKCPAGYVGSYCQFIEGSVPSDWSLDSYVHPQLQLVRYPHPGYDDPLLLALVIAFFLLVPTCILLGCVFNEWEVQKRLARAEAADLELDADGGVLREAMNNRADGVPSDGSGTAGSEGEGAGERLEGPGGDGAEDLEEMDLNGVPGGDARIV